jgi:hypothetical protein
MDVICNICDPQRFGSKERKARGPLWFVFFLAQILDRLLDRGRFDLERMQLEGQRLSKFGFQISKYGKVLICNVEDYTKKDV